MSQLYVYDWESMKDYAEVSFLHYDDNELHTFVFDDDTGQCDRNELLEFVKGKTLVGYNNLTFDNILTNYVIKHKNVNASQLQNITHRIINGQKNKEFNIYKEFKDYIYPELYDSIDLMRLLFSKKLRVSLKELECSLNYENVQEFSYPYDQKLTKDVKKALIEYNINDCKATKLVLQKSIKALQLRRWMQTEYGLDAFNLDSVNGGVKILEVLYEKEIGSAEFKKQRTLRERIDIKDIILPQIKFETKAFQSVLNLYRKHTWFSKHFDEELFEDSKFKEEPLINGFRFKFSLGGLHGFTQPGIWKSDDEYEILSIDVASYYPSLVLKHRFAPGHLNKEVFLRIYSLIKEERMAAKASGNKLKNETLKLSINGTYGMFGNFYSWLFDHMVRLQICVNGQLFLAMLIEKLFKANIQLIDANTDGIFVKVHKSQKDELMQIIKNWEEISLMEMEITKFEKVHFLNTADYFATYLDKGELKTKEKGMFLSETQLGKGMEFPVIAEAVKSYFLKGISVDEYIKKESNVLKFCSYKKLKRDTQCFHNNIEQQRVNRFYACKSGAYLFAHSRDEETGKLRITNLLVDSPVTLYNKVQEEFPKDLNYGFYLSKAREIVYTIEGQKQLF